MASKYGCFCHWTRDLKTVSATAIADNYYRNARSFASQTALYRT